MVLSPSFDSTTAVLAKSGLLDNASTFSFRPPVITDSDCEIQDLEEPCQHAHTLDAPPCILDQVLSRDLKSQLSHKIVKNDSVLGCLALPSPSPCIDATNLHFSFGGGQAAAAAAAAHHAELPAATANGLFPRDLCHHRLTAIGPFKDEWERYHDEEDEDDAFTSCGGSSWDEPGTSVSHTTTIVPCDTEDQNPSSSKQSAATEKNSTSKSTGGGVPSDTVAGATTGSGSSGPARAGTKRSRAPSDVMSSDHESQPSRPRRLRTEDRPRVILACPFYKWNPARYRNCRRILLTKISYVKQHILRAHRMPPHCQICNALFQTDEQLRHHIRSMTCTRRPYSPPDGVTEDQIFQLRSRVNQKNSLEGQWYEVYDIIFPNAQRPASVHLDPELSQDLDEFVSYLTTNGPDIILERIKFSDLVSRDSLQGINADTLRSDLSSGFQEVYDRWYKSRAGEEGSPSSSSLPRPAASAPPDTHILRPSPRPLPPIAASHRGHGSLNLAHQTAFALGGSDELAPLRLSRRATHDTGQRASPLGAQMPTPERSDHWHPPAAGDRNNTPVTRPPSPPPR